MVEVDYRALVSVADLIYHSPVSKPGEGQPIGNGVMGTLVWTSPGAIHLQINRADVFSVNKNHSGKRAGSADSFGGCACVEIEVGGRPFEAREGFRQRLSLYEAESTIVGEQVGARCFVSSVADVLALELEDQRAEPHDIKVKVSLWRAPEVKTGSHLARYEFGELNGGTLIVQKFSDGDYGCASAVSTQVVDVVTEAEQTSDRSRTIVSPARKGRRLILISSAASWEIQQDVGAEALQLLDAACNETYEDLKSEHLHWWVDLWSRTFIQLESADGLAEFMQCVRYLQLYYMASSSRGRLPAKWNGSLFLTEGKATHWGSQFWVWTTQISYYPLHAADAVELTEPLFAMYADQLPAAEQAAKQRWDATGAYFLEAGPFDGPVVLPGDVAQEYRDVYLGRKPNTQLSARALSFGQFECVLAQFADGRRMHGDRYSYVSHIATSGCKIAKHAWWRYRYTGDKQWLRSRAYPLLRGTVEFYRHLAKKEADGKYHLYGLNQFEGSWGTNDGLLDLAAIRGTAPLAILAAEILKVDADLRTKWTEFLENLAPFPMGFDHRSHGVVAPDLWATGHIGVIDLPRDTGADEAHLFPAFPFEVWTLETREPEIDRIVQELGESNKLRVDLVTGQAGGLGSAGRTPVIGSRLGRGEELPAMLAAYFAAFDQHAGPLPNGTSLFEGIDDPSIEPLGCISMALNEALVQSVSPRPGEPEIISVFPAWPQEWDASFRLLVRGGFLVSSSMRAAEAEHIELESRLGGPCRLRNPWASACTVEEIGGNIVEVSGDILRFDTSAAKSYRITAKGTPKPANRRISPPFTREPRSYMLTLPNGSVVQGTLGRPGL